MTKLRKTIGSFLVLILFTGCPCFIYAQQTYGLDIRCLDYEPEFLTGNLGVRTRFDNRGDCAAYVVNLGNFLHSKGYMTASVDSVRYDSSHAEAVVYLGDAYKWASLDAGSIDPALRESVGWREQQFEGKPMNMEQVSAWQERFLNFLENNGHPFAKVFLDSIRIQGGDVYAEMKVVAGPRYRIDSIRVFGSANISNQYLQQYLDIRNGSLYSKDKLLQINKKLLELSFVEQERAANLSMLGTGSVLNLYLKPRRSSQINVLLGFLPNSDQLSSKKLLVTGEATINLRNALGSGETIGLNWQQLQVKSPRLNIIYQHPYLFRSPLGLDFAFDMFRKDSTFLNVNLQLGAQYILSSRKTGKIYIQRFQTIVSDVNTNFILAYKRLPDAADVSSSNIGIEYQFNSTDYRLNPRKGNELVINMAAGIKKIKKNNQVLELKDPGNPSFDFGSLYDTVKLNTYQLRIKALLAKYLPVGQRGTVKTAVNIGIFQSANIFRNELFQIGGYRLLRGFDEESQYLNQYGVGTLEYRYLVGLNSYFFAFLDGGWGRNNSQNVNQDYRYLGTGLGLAFQTKAGIFNIAWAVGKRSDAEFNLRQSKIHFGFVNYF